MQSTPRPSAIATLALPLAFVTLAQLCGCARPGPPRPPSLYVPVAVTDLAASRSGDEVDLRFTAPHRSSDGLPLRAGSLRGVLCRQLGPPPSACIAVTGIEAPVVPATTQTVSTRDVLPSTLTTGTPQLLGYRVEFFNKSGRSVGASEVAYTLAGAAPTTVTDLTATGARNGIVLGWKPTGLATDEVLLERTDLSLVASPSAPKPHPVSLPRRPGRRAVASQQSAPSPNVAWLQANAETGDETLDAGVDPGTPYRYSAVRRRFVQLGGRKLEMRSAASLPVEITLRPVYPPAVPTGLNVAGYLERPGQPTSGFAVDLVWQPVDDDSRTAALAGYNIYRETLDAQGKTIASRTRLNAVPNLLPAFHDGTAKAQERYRYGVTAVDTKGNESEAQTMVLNTETAP